MILQRTQICANLDSRRRVALSDSLAHARPAVLGALAPARPGAPAAVHLRRWPFDVHDAVPPEAPLLCDVTNEKKHFWLISWNSITSYTGVLFCVNFLSVNWRNEKSEFEPTCWLPHLVPSSGGPLFVLHTYGSRSVMHQSSSHFCICSVCCWGGEEWRC